MSKTYQNSKIDASGLAVPERVSVAMDEIVADMREGLLALAVGTGLQEPPGWSRRRSRRTCQTVAAGGHDASTRASPDGSPLVKAA